MGFSRSMAQANRMCLLNGYSRIRLAVTATMALASTDFQGGVPGSPTPVGASPLSGRPAPGCSPATATVHRASAVDRPAARCARPTRCCSCRPRRLGRVGVLLTAHRRVTISVLVIASTRKAGSPGTGTVAARWSFRKYGMVAHRDRIRRSDSPGDAALRPSMPRRAPRDW